MTLHLPLLVALGAIPLLTPHATAQSCGSVAPLQQIALDAVQQLALPGVGLRVDQRGQPVFADHFGSYSSATVVPIASTSKTFSAAVLMSLVDDGTITLADTLGQWLPEYATTPLANITLFQCFTHTSGLPSTSPLLSDTTITLRNAARQLTNARLREAPGTAFRYGGVGMQLAGAVCEVASGQPWQTLFANRIATPLGLSQTDYAARGPTLNPHIGGGMRSNRDELIALFDMLRNGGRYNNQQVLTAASVALMVADATSALPVARTPHLRNAPYGIGIWIERRDAQGRTTVAMGAGATGCVGWVDFARDAVGSWLAESSSTEVDPFLLRCYDTTAATLTPVGVRCLGRPTPIGCSRGLLLNATTWARDNQFDFGFRIQEAPVASLGALVWSAGPPNAGVPYLDLVSYVDVAQAGVESMLTDSLGAGLVSTPIPTGLVGLMFTAQAVVVDPTGCGRSGLVATPALALTVLR